MESPNKQQSDREVCDSCGAIFIALLSITRSQPASWRIVSGAQIAPAISGERKRPLDVFYVSLPIRAFDAPAATAAYTTRRRPCTTLTSVLYQPPYTVFTKAYDT